MTDVDTPPDGQPDPGLRQAITDALNAARTTVPTDARHHYADAVLAALQGLYVPPPPGSDRDKLPDHLLAALVDMPPYLSTGCETAQAFHRAVARETGLAGELADWAQRMHASCRLTRKQDMAPCWCHCHGGEVGQ